MGNLVMLDSGATVNACPTWYEEQFTVEASELTLQLRAANGEEVKHHGRRIVQKKSGDTAYRIPFEVADVAGPIIAYSSLEDVGWHWHSDQSGRTLWRNKDGRGETLKVERIGGVYWIRFEDSKDGDLPSWLCNVVAGEKVGPEADRPVKEKKVPMTPSEAVIKAHECTHTHTSENVVRTLC